MSKNDSSKSIFFPGVAIESRLRVCNQYRAFERENMPPSVSNVRSTAIV